MLLMGVCEIAYISVLRLREGFLASINLITRVIAGPIL
jgi:hypothetical protein